MAHTCPRRGENGMDSPNSPLRGAGTGLDEYRKGHGLVGQARGCSYCGSMSPDDFMEAVRTGVEIGPTDKSYKLYVDSMRGKFYTAHLSEEQGWEFDRLWKAHEINWGYPGAPYVGLYIPGPSTASTES
ncbi:MAG: hypothetical protein JWO46_1789 [Nocardioidaceae bacterium]|nr:hypothetical protein [Nocardioidaceae bacterium]